MALDVYAMHESALEKFLNDQEALRALVAEAPKAFWDDFDDGDDKEPDDDIDDMGKMTIPVVGPLMQSVPKYYAFYGIAATAYGEITAALVRAEANPAVKSVQLAINSPGGEVHGVDDVWQAIRTMTKPVGALNIGMIASAAYYLASAAQEIRATAPTNETGSIGVVIAGYDTSKADEKFGVKRVSIYSKNAPNKAQDFSTEKGLALLQDRADAFERVFHARVAEGRGIPVSTVAEQYGQGGIFIASDPDKTKPDALRMGLIDALGGTWQPTQGAAQFHAQIPAPAGSESTEEKSMTLSEFLASNPDAKAAFDKFGADQLAAGMKAQQDRVTKIRAYLESDAYPKAIKKLAVDVLSGETGQDALIGAIAVFDATKEEEATKAAALAAAGQDTASETHGSETEAFNKAKAAAAGKVPDIAAIIAADKGMV